MNNRKPTNKRGKITRQNFIQEIPEAKEVTVNKKKSPNPLFGKMRHVVHQQVPKITGSLWGQK